MQSASSLVDLRRAGKGLAAVRLLWALVVTIVAAGCANLQAVNTAADQLVSTASSWNSVADEFADSCARRNQVSDALSDCTAEKRTTAGLEAADKLLSAYFTALKQASTSSNFSVASGISGLTSSVQAIPKINTAQTQAISALASFLANVATSALEQRTISVLIADGAPKAQGAIDVLTRFVVPQLQNIFDREQSQTLATFASYVQQSGAPVNLREIDCASALRSHSFPTGISYLLAQAYCARITSIATKRSALASYKASLATATNTLQSLQDGKDNLGAKALAQELISQASSLKGDVTKINKAF